MRIDYQKLLDEYSEYLNRVGLQDMIANYLESIESGTEPEVPKEVMDDNILNDLSEVAIYGLVVDDSEVVIATDDTIRQIVADAINEYGPNADLNFIDTSAVTDMSYLFGEPINYENGNIQEPQTVGSEDNAYLFNGDISGWDVSNVTNMEGMLSGCANFNRNLSGWDVSNVTNMSNMFNGCINFNSDLSGWNVSNVTDMSYMFHGCTNFNQDLSGWDISGLTGYEYGQYMIVGTPIIHDRSLWPEFPMIEATDDTIRQIVIEAIDEHGLNADLNFIDTSAVTNMGMLFAADGPDSPSFSGDISGWDVSKVTNMGGMFVLCENFNSDLSAWNVSNVTDMNSMFAGCNNFNSDLSGWDVSKVTNMGGMFVMINPETGQSLGDNVFNSDISSWDVSNVTDMRFMFAGCTAFDQDLSGWNIMNLTNCQAMFMDSAMEDKPEQWPNLNNKLGIKLITNESGYNLNNPPQLATQYINDADGNSLSIISTTFDEATQTFEYTFDNCIYSLNGEESSGMYTNAFTSINDQFEVILPNYIGIEDFSFAGCSGLTTFNIPETTLYIVPNAFIATGWYNNQNDGILYLDNICIGYKGEQPTGALIIQDGTYRIAHMAFWNCSELTSIEIPDSVTTIENYAFGSTGLTSMTCYSTTPPVVDDNIGIDFVSSGVVHCYLYVPEESVNAYKNASWITGHNYQDAVVPIGYIPPQPK